MFLVLDFDIGRPELLYRLSEDADDDHSWQLFFEFDSTEELSMISALSVIGNKAEISTGFSRSWTTLALWTLRDTSLIA